VTGRRPLLRASAVAAVLALVVACVGLVLTREEASASTLTVTGGRGASVTRTACATSAVVVRASQYSGTSTTQVTVEGLTPAELTACSGKSIRVATANASAVVLADVTGTVSAAAPVFAVNLPTDQVTATAVLIDGFVLRSTWQPPVAATCTVWKAGVATGDPCTVVATVNNVWGVIPARSATLNFSITPTLPSDKYATVTFDLSLAFAKWTGFPSVTAWNWAGSAIEKGYPIEQVTSCSLPKFTARTATSPGTGSLQVNELKTFLNPGSCP
jgi:hypothetical protein